MPLAAQTTLGATWLMPTSLVPALPGLLTHLPILHSAFFTAPPGTGFVSSGPPIPSRHDVLGAGFRAAPPRAAPPSYERSHCPGATATAAALLWHPSASTRNCNRTSCNPPPQAATRHNVFTTLSRWQGVEAHRMHVCVLEPARIPAMPWHRPHTDILQGALQMPSGCCPTPLSKAAVQGGKGEAPNIGRPLPGQRSLHLSDRGAHPCKRHPTARACRLPEASATNTGQGLPQCTPDTHRPCCQPLGVFLATAPS